LYTWVKFKLIDPPEETIAKGNTRPVLSWSAKTVAVCEARIKMQKELILRSRARFPDGKRVVAAPKAPSAAKATEATRKVAAPAVKKPVAKNPLTQVTEAKRAHRKKPTAASPVAKATAPVKQPSVKTAETKTDTRTDYQKRRDREDRAYAARVSIAQDQEVKALVSRLETATLVAQLNLTTTQEKLAEAESQLQSLRVANTKMAEDLASQRAKGIRGERLTEAANHATLAAQATAKEAQDKLAATEKELTTLRAKPPKLVISHPAAKVSQEVLTALREKTEWAEKELLTVRTKNERLEVAVEKYKADAGGRLSLEESNLLKAWLLGFVFVQAHQAKTQRHTAECPADVANGILNDFEIQVECKDRTVQLISTPKNRVPLKLDQPPSPALQRLRKQLAAGGN
jgi:hypothetical protein